MKKTGVIAVITGDLVDSSNFDQRQMNGIIDRLNAEFSRLKQVNNEKNVRFSLYRGDSFQGVVEAPERGLQIALRLKALINSYHDPEDEAGNKTPPADVRISIGVGEAHYDLDAIHVSNGAAFQLSGRTLDTMKATNAKLSLTTLNTEIDEEFRVHLRMLDRITDRWSTASAEVVYYLLQHLKEQQIATKLNRSQAAINLRKKAASWEEISLLLKRYEKVIKSYSK